MTRLPSYQTAGKVKPLKWHPFACICDLWFRICAVTLPCFTVFKALTVEILGNWLYELLEVIVGPGLLVNVLYRMKPTLSATYFLQ